MTARLTTAIFGGFALIASASAATIVQTEEFAFVPDGSQTLTFDRFDTLGGTRTLNSVTVTVTLNKTGGRFEVDNDSDQSGTINLSHTLQGSLTAVGVTLLRDDFSQIGATGTLSASSTISNVTIGATTGDNTDAFDATGLSDHYSYNPVNATDSDSGQIGAAFMAAYIGNDTYTMTINATQLGTVTGLGGLQRTFTVSNASGQIQVVYDYTEEAIPEPSAALLGGLGLLGLLRRRRA